MIAKDRIRIVRSLCLEIVFQFFFPVYCNILKYLFIFLNGFNCKE